MEWIKMRRVHRRDRPGFLKILDVTLEDDNGEPDLMPLFECADTAYTTTNPSRPLDAVLENKLSTLECQASNSIIRVYMEYGLDHESRYLNHLNQEVFKDDEKRPTKGGYEGLSKQWKNKIPKSWVQIPGFAFNKIDITSFLSPYRSSDFAIRFKDIGKDICILEHDDGRLTCELHSLTFSNPPG